MAVRSHITRESGSIRPNPTIPDFDFIVGKQEWRNDAACLGTDPSMWFRDLGKVYGPKMKAICASCPVQQECEDWILNDVTSKNDPVGLVAGWTPRQRALMRRDRARQAS